MNRCGRLIVLGMILASFLAPKTQAEDPPAIRVVNCNAVIQSSKRGVAENHLSAEDFAALAPGVSWYYNWHFKTDDIPPAGVKMEYIPMVWGDTQERLDGLEAYLAAGNKPRAVFAINEPNLKGQAFITPEQTAKLFLKTKAIADKYKLPVVGPHMALGSAEKDSISADDPIENKKVTYKTMAPFLKAFIHFAGSAKQIDSFGVHGYGNVGEVAWMSNVLTKEFDKPVWVTEYAWPKAADDAEELKYLIQATDLLERSPQVKGYAWFKERDIGNKRISLFEKEPGKLSAIGRAYVTMPVHDADIYYRLPGKLSAGRYFAMRDMLILPTTDSAGIVDMMSERADAKCDYHLQIDTPGQYVVRVRAAGVGGAEFGKNVLRLNHASGNDWKTTEIAIQLDKGLVTFTVQSRERNQRIAWIEFLKP